MTMTLAAPEQNEAVSTCADRECPGCGHVFEPKRKNQRYCARACQKKATHNAARGPRLADASPARQHDLRRKREVLDWLNRSYYETPPADRPDLLRGWMDDARRYGGGLLYQVLATPGFFNPKVDDRRRVSFRRCWAYPPVPYIADQYCVAVLDCRIWQWVNGTAPEPETGEVIEGPNLLAA